jgi:hypothetical protein
LASLRRSKVLGQFLTNAAQHYGRMSQQSQGEVVQKSRILHSVRKPGALRRDAEGILAKIGTADLRRKEKVRL